MLDHSLRNSVGINTYGLASQGTELGKTVLALSTLGLFTKLLNVDLGNLQVFGVALRPENADLLPGFLGLALTYTFFAFCIARIEAVIEGQICPEALAETKRIFESKPLLGLAFLAFPLSGVVYLMPYILGIFAIHLLWSDTVSVAGSIWALASK
jgi:hypothetical protein